MEGRVTGIQGGALVGWLADDADGRDALLEGLADDAEPFGRAAGEPGEDGRLRFSIPIPGALRDGRMRFLEVRAIGSAGLLAGGPVIFDGGLLDEPASPVRAIERAAPPVIIEGEARFTPPAQLEGWAWAPGEPGRRLGLEILAGGRFICAITADQPREDLRAQGIGDAHYGFRVDLSKVLRHGPYEVVVRPSGLPTPLPGGRFSAGPFAADGEVGCPGYLDDAASRALLASMPFEHLAWNARRIAPERLMSRLINRLRRERLGVAEAPPPRLALLLLAGGPDDDAARAFALQSYPGARCMPVPSTPAGVRALAEAGGQVMFAAGEDLIHPSAALVLSRLQHADVITWNRFCADEARAGSAGTTLRRPLFEPLTARHGALTDTTLAVRAAVLARAPDEVLRALCAGRMHPLWFWLAGQSLAFEHVPATLTSSVGPPAPAPREQILKDETALRGLLEQEDCGLELQRTREDLSFPFALIPRRRAAKTSVLVCFRGRTRLTLRCLYSLARQRLSGELEVVLVDNRSAPEETAEILSGARRLLGRERVALAAYDAPFNHSAQNNLAARTASGEALVICNNDVVLQDPFLLEQLCAWALQPGIGAVGCRLEDPERGVGSYGQAFVAPTEDPFRPPLRENPDPTHRDYVHACPGVTLALAAVARERFLDLGGLDERRFPIGYNDVDFMLRAGRRGLTHLYLGHVRALHPRGSSRTGDNEDLQAVELNRWGGAPAMAYVLQLASQRIDARAAPPRRAEPKDAAATGEADAEELRRALEAALEARRKAEGARADLARTFAKAARLSRELGEEFSAAKALGG